MKKVIKIKSLCLLALAILFVVSSVKAADAVSITTGSVGFFQDSFQDPLRGKSVHRYAWYPTSQDGPAVEIGRGPVFESSRAQINAEASLGRHPLVLISHGSGGIALRLSWLAAELAKRGMIVIAVDHPENMWGDNQPQGVLEVWKRTQDLSRLLDTALSDERFKNRINPSRIYAIGHSAGGGAALLLAGALLEWEKFKAPVQNCKAKDPIWMDLCKKTRAIPKENYPKEVIEKSYFDARVKKVVALDPGFGREFRLKSVNIAKSRILVLAAANREPGTDDLGVRALNEPLGSGHFSTIPDSVHMSFLDDCKSNELEKDPELSDVCQDNAGRSRVHAVVLKKIIEFFN